jgi:YVTN family beta-propeller protein
LGAIAFLLLSSIAIVPGSARTSSQPPSPNLANLSTGSTVGIAHHRLVSTPLKSANPQLGYLNGTPAWLAYDTATQSLYVAVPPSSVDIAPTNFTVTPWTPGINVTVPVGSDPFGVAYDNATGDVFVTNTGSNNVSVLYGNLSSPLTSIPVGARPMGVAYDSMNGNIYVANNGSANVSVINGTTLTVTANIGVGTGPVGVAADPGSGEVFVADYGSDQVTDISTNTGSVVATADVGIEPYGLALDNASGEVYVTNQGSSNVSVLSGSNAGLLATISIANVGDLQGVAYDSGDGYVWIGAGDAFTVVIDPTNESVLAFIQFDPSGVVYDPDNGDVCVTNSLNTTLECVILPEGATYGPPVVVSETGLPPGSLWSVIVGAGEPDVISNTSLVAIYSPFPDAFADAADLTVLPSGVYFPGPLERSGYTGFTVAFSSRAGVYPVTFTETGLPWPPYSPWSATLDGITNTSNTTSLWFPEPNGTFAFSIADYYSIQVYYPDPYAGTFSVDGSNVEQAIVFSTQAPPSECQGIVFNETGLPTGTSWGVTLGTTSEVSTRSCLFFNVTAGVYSFSVGSVPGYTASPQNGTVTFDGTYTGETITFTPTPVTATYLVSFAESGLPNGTSWRVSLDEYGQNSSFTVIRFSEPNGTYIFSIGAGSAYLANPNSGPVTVDGANVVVPISFVLANSSYTISFVESGLVTGTNWTVGLGGTHVSSPTDSIRFFEPNGTYPYTISTVAGYSTNYTGHVVVNGGPVTVSVTFAPSGPATHLGPTLEPTPLWVWILIAAIIIAAAVVVFVLVLGRKPVPPSSP